MVWQAEGEESRQAEGDDEPDVEKIGRGESVQAVCHRQPAQQRGHEGGQHHKPPGPAADAERQGRQQRTGHRHHRQPGHPGAVLPAGVAQSHDQRPEDRGEEVPPLGREHAHDNQQPQDDPDNGTSAQVESLPVELEYLRQPAHDSPLSTLACGPAKQPSRGGTGRRHGPGTAQPHRSAAAGDLSPPARRFHLGGNDRRAGQGGRARRLSERVLISGVLGTALSLRVGRSAVAAPVETSPPVRRPGSPRLACRTGSGAAAPQRRLVSPRPAFGPGLSWPRLPPR